MNGRARGPTRPLFATVAYAEAFGLGTIDLPEWQTVLLKRPIPSTDWSDALSCYPFTVFGKRPDLTAGLKRLSKTGLVSVALVPDPLNSPSSDLLCAAFEVCHPFKTHYLIDRNAGPVLFARTHRRMIRKALKDCTFGPVNLQETLGDWQRLYGHTVARHGITGIQNFAPSYFEALAHMPEIIPLAAHRRGKIIAMILWVRSGEIAYAHLEGSSVESYKTQAVYGIFATANEYFADCRILHFGGAAGANGTGGEGLAYFKRGFANREVTAYFCGSRLDVDRYAKLIGDQPHPTFFPAYRKP
jgi:hypothetical protein